MAAADQGWRFERRVSLDTLVGIIGVAVVIGGPMFYWARNMEDRVQRLEVLQAAGDKEDAAHSADEREWRADIAKKVDKIESKVTDLQINVGRLVPSPVEPRK